MTKIFSLMAGGAVGTLLRYVLSGYAHRLYLGVFPLGTLLVNLTGSLAIGLLWGLSEVGTLSPNARAFLFMGLFGGFTTFSTFTLETMNLLREGEMKLALTNLFVSNVMGIALVMTGFALARSLLNLWK